MVVFTFVSYVVAFGPPLKHLFFYTTPSWSLNEEGCFQQWAVACLLPVVTKVLKPALFYEIGMFRVRTHM
jgi:hypothetical protein